MGGTGGCGDGGGEGGAEVGVDAEKGDFGEEGALLGAGERGMGGELVEVICVGCVGRMTRSARWATGNGLSGEF